MSGVPGQRPVGPQQGEAAHGGSGPAPANRPVRAAGLVVYVYAALLVGTAVACLVGAVGSYRAATAPCPDTDTTCESFGIVGAVVLVATAASGGLLAAFLRQESRVAVWLTLVLGGISVLCLTFLGVAAWGGDQPGTAASCPDPVLRWPRWCERPTVCFLTSVLSVEAHGRGHGRSADGPGPGRSP